MNAKTILAFSLLAVMTTSAQTIIVYDSLVHNAPTSTAGFVVVDSHNQNTTNNPDFEQWMRGIPSVSLVDVPTRVHVLIVDGITNAVAQLNAALSNSVPATVRERNTPTTKDERSNRASTIRNGNGLNDVKETLARMAEEIELLNERLERLESNQ